MDRLARNLDDLRLIVQKLTKRGVRIEFVKENLTFTGEDSPLANLMLSVMGAFAEFERALIGERQREGIALAKQRGAYRGRKKSLSPEQAAQLRQRVQAGARKAPPGPRVWHLSRNPLSIPPHTTLTMLRGAGGIDGSVEVALTALDTNVGLIDTPGLNDLFSLPAAAGQSCNTTFVSGHSVTTLLKLVMDDGRGPRMTTNATSPDH